MAFLKPKLNNGSIVVTCTECGTVVPEKVSECPVCSPAADVVANQARDKELEPAQADSASRKERKLDATDELKKRINTGSAEEDLKKEKKQKKEKRERKAGKKPGDKSSHSSLATIDDLINEHNVTSGDQIEAATGGKTTSLDNIAKATLSAAEIKPPRDVVSSAPFRARLLAALIDHGLIYVTSFFLLLLAAFPLQQYLLTGHAVAGFEILLKRQMGVIVTVLGFYWLAVLFVPMLYYTWFESSDCRGTPGKLLAGLRIVPLHSTKIGFWQASVKFGLQALLLYGIAIVSALGAMAMVAVAGESMINPIIYTVEFVLIAAAFCMPVFKGKSQTLLDLLSRRIVIPKGMLPQYLHQASLFNPVVGEPIESKRITYSRSRLADAIFWLVFGLIGFVAGAIGLMVTTKFEVMLGILAVAVIVPAALRRFFASQNISRMLEVLLKTGILIAIGAGLLFLIPYNIEMWSGIINSVPLAEKAFAIDPTLQKPEAKAHIDEAKKVFRDVDFPYGAGATALKGLGFTDGSLSLREKYAALSNNPERQFFNLGELYEQAGRTDDAIAAYEKVAAMKPSKTVSSSLISDANTAINRLKMQRNQRK